MFNVLDFVYLSSDLQSAFSRFQGVIDLYLDTNFKKLTFMMNYENRCPWITEALRTKIKTKIGYILLPSHPKMTTLWMNTKKRRKYCILL